MPTASEVMMELASRGETNREVLLEEAVERANVSRDHAAKIYRRDIGTSGPAPRIRTKGHRMQPKERGISREQAREMHDIPHKIVKALDKFISEMQPERFYEESEVKRICRISNADKDYWEEITSEHRFAQHTGFTEAGMRLWGTLEDIHWGLENITGFRRGE
jgi:hypothetical protein